MKIKITPKSYGAFITGNTKYALLDDEGDIRATASTLVDIVAEKQEKGWGTIHRCEYNNLTLEIKESIEDE